MGQLHRKRQEVQSLQAKLEHQAQAIAQHNKLTSDLHKKHQQELEAKDKAHEEKTEHLRQRILELEAFEAKHLQSVDNVGIEG